MGNFSGANLSLKQTADGGNFGAASNQGLKVYGYDDRSDRYIQLQVDQYGYGALTSKSNIYIAPSEAVVGYFYSSGFGFTNDKKFTFGSAASQQSANFNWNTYQTVDALQLGLSNWSGYNQGRYMIVTNYDDYNFDFKHPEQANPTIFIHSANRNTSQWMSLAHDGTRGVLDTGTGFLRLNASVNISGDTYVNNKKDIYYNGADGNTIIQPNMIIYNGTPSTGTCVWTINITNQNSITISNSDIYGIHCWCSKTYGGSRTTDCDLADGGAGLLGGALGDASEVTYIVDSNGQAQIRGTALSGGTYWLNCEMAGKLYYDDCAWTALPP